MILALFLLQAAQPASTPPEAGIHPDIQLDVRLTARRVTIENKGEVDLTLRTSLNGREGENNILDVTAPELPPGRTELNNVVVNVRAEARIPQPGNAAPEPEPIEPQ